jgi:biopolymer transport protein ExbD
MKTRRDYRREAGGFNMTPLIDMVFTLLIFFTLTLQIQKEQAAKIQLPKADQAEEAKKIPPQSLLVLVERDGSLYVNGQRKALADFEEDVANYSAESLPKELVVRGDGEVPYRVVQGVMRAASNVGITKVNLTASRETEDLR